MPSLENGPLAGIRVLDLTRVVSGPFCTMQLGDLGADVVKIEEPENGDDSRAFGPPFVGGEAAYYLSVNRNKRSLAIDLKAPEAQSILRAIAERSDVVVENFRPGTADRLGLGFDHVSAWNPRIVYCSISGFGSTGPERDRPGYDLIVQGESGIMDITGSADGPPNKVGTSIADLVSGLYATQAILGALRLRDRTGQPQRVEVAMIDAMASLLTFNAGIYFASGRSPVRRGNAHPTIVPYETFRAADGWINVGVANDAIWGRFCVACDRLDLKDDPRFATASERVRHRPVITPILEEMIAAEPRRHWIERLDAHAVPCGEIRTVEEVCTSAALVERGFIQDLPHPTLGQVRTTGSPVRFDAKATTGGRAAPLHGEHTRAILADVAGLSEDEIDRLAATGVVRFTPPAAPASDGEPRTP